MSSSDGGRPVRRRTPRRHPRRVTRAFREKGRNVKPRVRPRRCRSQALLAWRRFAAAGEGTRKGQRSRDRCPGPPGKATATRVGFRAGGLRREATTGRGYRGFPRCLSARVAMMTDKLGSGYRASTAAATMASAAVASAGEECRTGLGTPRSTRPSYCGNDGIVCHALRTGESVSTRVRE